MSLQDSHQISEVKVLLKKGADGTGIVDIELTGSSGDVDTYTITLTNGDKYTFTVTNGSSIASIEKTGTSGNVDTYTITLTNGDTYTFTVTNATGSSADGITYDNTQSGASATNVQDALDEAFSDVETLNTSLGTKANKADLTDINLTGSTNTTGATIPSGYYFYLNGTLVRAKTDIASGATFTLNTNYEVVSIGALNDKGEDLLWSNPDYTATFNNQTISVDLTKYDEAKIEYCLYNNNSSNRNIRNIDTVSVGCSHFLFIYNETGFIYKRGLDVLSSGIDIGGCINFGTNNPGVDNNACVPTRIWGVKH